MGGEWHTQDGVLVGGSKAPSPNPQRLPFSLSVVSLNVLPLVLKCRPPSKMWLIALLNCDDW